MEKALHVVIRELPSGTKKLPSYRYDDDDDGGDVDDDDDDDDDDCLL